MITESTIVAHNLISKTFLLKVVCVAAQTVANANVKTAYPATLWYLYIFFALSTPPYREGTKYCVKPMVACMIRRRYVMNPRMEWADSKCGMPFLYLLTSMTTHAAMNAANAMSLRAACAYVPSFFCCAVCVGCRMRAPWARSSNAAELSSYISH